MPAMTRSPIDSSSSHPRKKHRNRLRRNPIAKSVSRSLVSFRRSVARSFSKDEEAETKTTADDEDRRGDEHDDAREYMEDYSSELASARDAIDAIASGRGGEGGALGEDEVSFEATFDATLPGDESSLEALRLEEVEKEGAVLPPTLEIQPSIKSNAEEKEGGDEAARLGEEALLFIYGHDPDLRRDVFQLSSTSSFRDVKGAYKKIKEQIDLALGCPSQYQREVAVLFGMTSEHMAFLSPRSFVEIKRDAIARAYAILLKEEEDAKATKKEDDKKAPREKEAREEFVFGVFGREENDAEKNDAEENAEEAPPSTTHASDYRAAFPSPESFAETKRDVVARAHALLSAEENSGIKKEVEVERGREETRRELDFGAFDDEGWDDAMKAMPEARSSDDANVEKVKENGDVRSENDDASSSGDDEGDEGITELAEIVTVRRVSDVQREYQRGGGLESKRVQSSDSDLEKGERTIETAAPKECTGEVEFEGDVFEGKLDGSDGDIVAKNESAVETAVGMAARTSSAGEGEFATEESKEKTAVAGEEETAGAEEEEVEGDDPKDEENSPVANKEDAEDGAAEVRGVADDKRASYFYEPAEDREENEGYESDETMNTANYSRHRGEERKRYTNGNLVMRNTANRSHRRRGEERKSYEGGEFVYHYEGFDGIHYEGLDGMHPDDEEASNVTGVSDFTSVSNFTGVIDHVYCPREAGKTSEEEEEAVLPLINRKKFRVGKNTPRGRHQQNHSPTDPMEFDHRLGRDAASNRDRFTRPFPSRRGRSKTRSPSRRDRSKTRSPTRDDFVIHSEVEDVKGEESYENIIDEFIDAVGESVEDTVNAVEVVCRAFCRGSESESLETICNVVFCGPERF